MPSTLGGTGDASLQNLSWLNVMSEDKEELSTKVKRNSFQSSKSFDDMTGRRAPIFPRPYQSTKKDADSKAHPFATTTAQTDSLSVNNFPARMAQAAADKRQPTAKQFILPPSAAAKNSNIPPSSVANKISNWEIRNSVKNPSSDALLNGSGKIAKQSSDKGQNPPAVNGLGNVSKMAGRFAPSETLKINWRQECRQDNRHESVCSNDGDYVRDWIPSGTRSEYQNVVIDKPHSMIIDQKPMIIDPKPTIVDQKPFSLSTGAVPNQTKQPTSYENVSPANDNSSNPYEVVNYQPATAQPVKPHPPTKRPMIPSGSAKVRTLNHSYVNVDIPSDLEPGPPPVPLKKKKPPVKTVVGNDQSDDSELDEEEGNESQYENWSFLNPREGDQNMTISELEAYVKSRKLQGLKAEYFKIRNKPDPSEMNICR